MLANGLDRLLRALVLGAADSGRVRAFVDRYGLRLGAARFVAGETIDDCVRVLRTLNARGLHANTTILGEQVVGRGATLALAREYKLILDRIDAEGLRCNVAVKLTQLGLLLDEELAFHNVARLADHAAALGNSIRIDMEQSDYVDATLRLYRRLRESGREAVGCALQAYLRRTEEDLRALLPLRPNVRIVKGAYLEAATTAYARKSDVDANYARLLELVEGGGAYAAVATHDDRLIEHALRVAGRHGIGPDRFEFQMLYGVRPRRQLELSGHGHKMLVATPFGLHWYPYLMRRLAERPANLGIDAATWTSPPLTTIEQPIDEIAQTAVDALRSQIHEPDKPLPNFLFRPRLCVRASTAPPADTRRNGHSRPSTAGDTGSAS